MITKDTIQQIQSRIDIVEVIGGFVKLKKRGVNYLGNCPFHNEKTPSFTVSPSKEIYKCFGCGKSGNAIGFLMDHEKYSYVEALRWLAQKYNVEVVETEVSPEQKQQQQTADSLYIINQFAQQYFSDYLFKEDEGVDIGLSYLKERGFREEIVKKFQLGFCPSTGHAFADAALEGQYNRELLTRTGLVVERDGRLLDNYRGRIIFPVHNQSGKVMGFGARIIKSNDKAPKYINTPENEIYVKSRILYGMYFAKTVIDKEDECLLVEGYTDVISLHQAGVENVVASGGTSLTQDQLRLIRKYTDNLTIIYDGDAAGIKAALRGLDLAIEEGLKVKLVLLPDKEDPDSYVNRVGASSFRQYIAEHKKDFILFQLEVALAEAGKDSNAKAAIVNQMAESLARMNKPEDFTRRNDYIRSVSGLLKIDEQGFHSLVNKMVSDRVARDQQRGERNAMQEWPELPEVAPAEDTLDLLRNDERQERAMLRCLLEFGAQPYSDAETVAEFLFREIRENELDSMIHDPSFLQVLQHYRSRFESGNTPSAKDFLYLEDQEISKYVIGLMEVHEEISENWKEYYQGIILTRNDLYREEALSSITYLKLRKIKGLIAENEKELERTTDPEEQLLCMKAGIHLKEVERELSKLAGIVIYK